MKIARTAGSKLLIFPPPRAGSPYLCLASNHKEALSMMREAFTYFLTCPSSRVWGFCQRAKSGVLAGSYRLIPYRTQLIDALNEF